MLTLALTPDSLLVCLPGVILHQGASVSLFLFVSVVVLFLFLLVSCLVCVCVCFFDFFFLLIFLVMSGRPRRDMSSLASGNKLQPSVLHDTTGPYVIVTCGSVSGRLYLSKLDESKNPCPSVSMSMVLGTLPLMLRAWLARRVRNGSNLYVTFRAVKVNYAFILELQ